MEQKDQTTPPSGLYRPEPAPGALLRSGRRSFLQALSCAYELLSPLIPVRCVALFRREEEVCLCWEGRLIAQAPLMEIFRSLNSALDWTQGDPCAHLESLAVSALGDTAFLCLPLREEDGGLLGLALLGKEGESGAWSQDERALAAPVRALLELTAGWVRWSGACMQQNNVLNEIMDSLSAGIYITDPETDQILFMNKTMKRMFSEPHPEGKVCWRVLQKGMNRRCDFCPIPLLQSSGEEHPSCLWEETNSGGRVFENHDMLIPWVDGRTVHIQQSLDVTEVRRLYQAATIDDLTGLLNRPAGRSALQKLLDRAAREHKVLTVCQLDIDDLESINETFGHEMGDAVIQAVACALREAVGPEGCRFRMGGDEFMAALWDVDLSGAAEAMRQMRSALERLRPPGLPHAPTFRAGLLELPPDHALSLTDVLGAADDKLYEQKRAAHIQRAGLLSCGGGSVLSPEEFEYDSALLYPALVQSTDDYIYVCNMKTDTFRYPPGMAEEFALPSQVIQNAAAVWGAKVHAEDRMAFLESNQSITDGRTESHCVEYRAQNRRGEWVWLRCRGHMMRDETGQPALFAGIITNLGKKNKIDHLTGLLNRLEFEDVASHLLEQGYQGGLSMMVFGLDDLSHINSLYDRTFGDEVIRIASQKLQSMLPVNAYVFRLDGDEFGVLIRGEDPEIARAFYRRAQAAFSHQQTWEGRKFFCTLSCGCVFAPRDGTDLQSLVKYAHFALEHAKQSGKNQLCLFSRKLLLHRERLLELTELLRESVERKFEGFELYFQPITDGADQRLRGAEALCRWQCEKLGAVSPVEFIPILEQTGLILPVGRWIFRRAVETCARWQKIMPEFMMGVNLSNLQLEDPTFIDFMEHTILDSGATPSRVVVELTESYLASNVEALSTYLERLHHMHVLVSMDDFGTGYSSLGVLKQYPIDIVKIDRTFVKGVQSSAFDSAFIQFVVDLCHKLGINVLLEGVETREELDVVSPMRLNFFQGYFFGHPMPAERFERELLSGAPEAR